MGETEEAGSRSLMIVDDFDKVCSLLLSNWSHRFPADEYVRVAANNDWDGALELRLWRVKGTGFNARKSSAIARIEARDLDKLDSKDRLLNRVLDELAYLVAVVFPVLPKFRLGRRPSIQKTKRSRLRTRVVT